MNRPTDPSYKPRFTGTGTTIPFARPLQRMDHQELFDETSRLSILIDNLAHTISKLVASGDQDDLFLAASIQTYKITQESKLVAVQAQILATRR